MAPLIGANRKWIKEFMPLISKTSNKGIISILRNLKLQNNRITTDDIGYKIAPLINAVGRIGDPKLVIDLLTSNSEIEAMKKVKECILLNKRRRSLTSSTEQEALEINIFPTLGVNTWCEALSVRENPW